MQISINKNSTCSWNRTSESEKKAGKGLFANNNASKSAFGGLTNQVVTYSMIGLTNAGGMAIARQNIYFNIDVDSLHAKNKHDGKNFTFYFILLLLTLLSKLMLLNV